MNKLDQDYQQLLLDIMANGVEKEDRTGTGTISVFGRQIRHNMQDGFPLLTTKKMAIKSIMTELKWFLKGDTNIKYLVDNGCNIWNGDAYKNYLKCNENNFIGLDVVYKNETYKIVDQHNINPDYVIINDANSSVVNLRWDSVLFDKQHLSQEEFINKIKTDDEFARKWGELGPIYGQQWRHWTVQEDWSYDGEYVWVDQIEYLVQQLKENPDSRRLMVNAWNVGNLPEMALPPCHYGFQVYTRELSLEERIRIYALREGQTYEEFITNWDTEKQWLEDLSDTTVPTRAISLMWNQRSVDTFLGLPFNIASYGMLLELIAKECNMIPDELIGNLGDVHLYKNHIKQANIQCGRQSHNLPKLTKLEGNLLEGEFDYTIEYYESWPKIEAPLSN